MDALYLFNPENDLALAANTPHYTPPAVAVEFGRSAACLPLWYAGEDDYVLAREWDNEWLQWVTESFGLRSKVVESAPASTGRVMPWGWSLHACDTLVDYGVDRALLPSSQKLDQYRQLSHRRNVISMFRRLGDMDLPYPMPPLPQEVTSDVEMARLLNERDRIFVKSPWSGSGRGVIDSATAPARQVLRLASGVIKRQGSVVVERGLDKVIDFAMLYDMHAEEAEYVGLSVFNNVNYSTYGGNILASEPVLIDMITKYVSKDAVDATRESVKTALQDIIGNMYEGPVGVDMLVYREGSQYIIDPCVEVNMRMTMGRVAHSFASQYLKQGLRGCMLMTRDTTNGNIPFNAVIKDGKLISGEVPLTSPHSGKICITCQVTPSAGKGRGAVIPLRYNSNR